jgi:general stress protein YciG
MEQRKTYRWTAGKNPPVKNKETQREIGKKGGEEARGPILLLGNALKKEAASLKTDE